MKPSTVTIKDLARQLGISKSTVSRALRNSTDIGAETKQRVIELAQKLDYNPNPVALSLLKSRSHAIGVIVPSISNPFFSIVISGIEDVAYRRNYHVMIYQSHDDYQREALNVRHIFVRRADGLIASVAINAVESNHFKLLEERNFPMVFFDRVCDEVEAPSVTVDDFEGAYCATEHLIKQGCQRIAHVSGPDSLRISKRRYQGYVSALHDYKIPPDGQYLVQCRSYRQEDGYTQMQQLLKLSVPPDGVFAASDNIASGCHIAIRDAGLRMPQDVALIGFSDLPIDTLLTPTMSSIAQPAFEMGQVAADLLIDLIEQDDKLILPPKNVVLKTSLVVRESSRKK